jgi:hypothetical protein
MMELYTHSIPSATVVQLVERLPTGSATSSGAQPASYPVGIGGSFPGGRGQGREADHSLPTTYLYIHSPIPHYGVALTLA